jgi:hypothetical protein
MSTQVAQHNIPYILDFFSQKTIYVTSRNGGSNIFNNSSFVLKNGGNMKSYKVHKQILNTPSVPKCKVPKL